jgi:hypothetical protein
MNKKDILEKVLKDEPKGFRKKFLKDPKKALEEITGKKFSNWNIEIKRIPKKTIVFELPEEMPSPKDIDENLLNKIAAGQIGGGQSTVKGALCLNEGSQRGLCH